MISVAFTGVDHVAMDYCRERGILVSNCAGYSNTAVPELVFGMVLSLYRSIVAAIRPCGREKIKQALSGWSWKERSSALSAWEPSGRAPHSWPPLLAVRFMVITGVPKARMALL